MKTNLKNVKATFDLNALSRITAFVPTTVRSSLHLPSYQPTPDFYKEYN